jgi:hypothetical protein
VILLQVSQRQERRLLLLDQRSVHGDGGRDYSSYQIGLGKFLAVNKHQRQVQETIFQVAECLEKTSASVIDRFFLLTHFFFSYLDPALNHRDTKHTAKTAEG